MPANMLVQQRAKVVTLVDDYGAQGNDATDDTTAIQAALNATPVGGVCELGAKSYRINSPLTIPPGVTLRGQIGRRVSQTSEESIPSRIKVLGTFSGAAALLFKDKEQGGYASENSGIRLRNLALDGSALSSGSVDGIQASGQVRDVILDNVSLYKFPHNGLTTQSYTRLDSSSVHPYSWVLNNVIAQSNGSQGIALNGLTDSDILECVALANTLNGFYLATMANCRFTSCRAEWNLQHGYYLTGGWGSGTGAGAATFVGCSTDRNGQNGVLIDATGTAPVIFSGHMARRDGRNAGSGGGGYAGLAGSSATLPIIIEGITTFPGVDDDGTQTNSPDYGVNFTSCTWVDLVSGYLHAQVAGYHDGGSNTTLRRGPNIGEATGSTSSPTRATANDWNTNGTETIALATADKSARTLSNSQANTNTPLDDITGAGATSRWASTKVSGDANRRFDVRIDGQQSWGDGTNARDTNLYRAAAAVLATDNNLDVVTHALGLWQPREGSLVAATFDPVAVRSSLANTPTGGTVYLAGLYVHRAASVTKIYWGIGTAGNTPTSNRNVVGLYNAAGTLLQSTVVDSSISSTGLKTTTISSQAVTPGLYWIGFVFNASTTPKLWCGGEIDFNLLNVGLSASTARYATNGTGQTTLSSITPGNNVISSAIQAAIWAAIG